MSTSCSHKFKKWFALEWRIFVIGARLRNQ
jgi:hypothetical protein